MKKWQIAVGILLVFALGTAAGAYGSRVIFKKRVNRVLHSEGTPGIKVIQGMVRRLDLSESQKTSINAILDENNKKWEAIRQEYEPQIKELFETVIEQTKKELTPQQREEVEKMSAMVQRRLPPHSSSRMRSSAPPEGSQPPESSAPPNMGQPYSSKPNSNRVVAIMEALQIDAKKSAAVRTIIEADLQTQAALREDFQKTQEAAEEKLRKKIAKAQLAIERKLEGFLTSDQMEKYRQLTHRDTPPPDDFMFDIPGDTMEPKGFQEEKLPQPEGGEPRNSDASWVL